MNFDRLQTREAIQTHVQALTRSLLSHSLNRLSETNSTIALDVLAELSYAQLKHLERPVFQLSKLCRLLIKSGDRISLSRCLALSRTIYTFKCRHNESWYISHLYKGIAQIGLHLNDIGIKNVLFVLSGEFAAQLVPLDRLLGYWAMMSAAIHNKNLKFAANFARQWEATACQYAVGGEMRRARLTRALFALLTEKPHSLAALADTPDFQEWQRVAEFLRFWGQVRASDTIMPEAPPVEEPYPLFLGCNWLPFIPLKEQHVEQWPDDFRGLCMVQRQFCTPARSSALPANALERCAQIVAHWEVPSAFARFDRLLQSTYPQQYHHHTMTRLLGKGVTEKVETAGTEITVHDHAIILVMDVRKYSSISEYRSPEEISALLNPIFKIMNEELEHVGGAILEFIGDSIIVVFNTFRGQRSTLTEILFHTIRCLHRLHVLNALSIQNGMPEMRIGVGIHMGPVALGYLGSLERCHLTVLGKTINLASRLESASKTLPGEVIVSAACFERSEPNWQIPCRINYMIRDVGEHTMRNMREPISLFGLRPLLQHWIDFVPMGFVACPEAGVVYIDTGNSDQPGVIDHHPGQSTDSACELLLRKPGLLLEHLEGRSAAEIEFRLHTLPDLDCCATLYVAYELMGQAPRRKLLWQLAAYVSLIDQGVIPRSERLSDSLKGIFIAHQRICESEGQAELRDFRLLEAGLRVIDAALYLMEKNQHGTDFSYIFQFAPDWFPEERRLIREDLARYHEDVAQRAHFYTARVNGHPTPVTGVWLDHPRSIFYKLWARNDPKAPEGRGYRFVTLDLSEGENYRYVIRVDPESGLNLKGLGQTLERHETLKRKKLGKERPVHPIRYPADNSDPWYFGQGHQYTIIDSPWGGSILTAEEVQHIHENW